jgi:hypothetical protein
MVGFSLRFFVISLKITLGDYYLVEAGNMLVKMGLAEC